MLLYELSQRQDTLAVIKKLRDQIKVMKSRKKPHHGKISRAQDKIRYLKQQVELLRKDAPFPAAPLQVRKPEKHYGEAWRDDKDSDEDVANRERAIDLIKKHCQPFLQQIDYDVPKYKMFRGYKGSNAAAVSDTINLTNRKPRDTSIEVHNMMNEYFESKFGEPFRNAMFVTGFEAHAEKYGTVFLVFPAGNFTFAWSPRVKDLYVAAGGSGGVDPLSGFAGAGTLAPEEFNKWMDKKIYSNTDLKSAIKQRNEIMIRGSGYYGINIGYSWAKPEWTKFMRYLGKRFKE